MSGVQVSFREGLVNLIPNCYYIKRGRALIINSEYNPIVLPLARGFASSNYSLFGSILPL